MTVGSESKLDGKFILVIDDEPELNVLLCDLLQQFGATAIGLTSLNPTGMNLRNGPHVIMQDLMLTGPYTGIDVAKMVRLGGYTGPIIAMSASVSMMALAEATGDLFQSHLTKPFDITDVYTAVAEVIEASGRD